MDCPKQRMLLHARPANGTSCGLLMSLSEMDRFALNVPVVSGANVTPISQELPEATLAAQGVVTENGPDVVWLLIVSADAPALVRVTAKGFFGWFEDVTFNPPKSKLAGIIFTVPGTRVIVAVVVLELSATEVAVIVTFGSTGTAAGAA